MVVDEELEADPRHQAVDRPGLGLRGGTGSPVGLTARLGRRALVVVAPLGREVAVEVDAVVGGDPAVAVVVAQVLAPQPVAGCEREVVAVGVGDRDEPQLGRVDQLGDRRVGAVAVDDVVGEAAHHLRRDPLPGVLGAEVERRRPAAVTDAAGVPGHLEGDDVLALHRLADRDQLGDVRMLGGELLELVLQAARRAVGPEHRAAACGRPSGVSDPEAHPSTGSARPSPWLSVSSSLLRCPPLWPRTSCPQTCRADCSERGRRVDQSEPIVGRDRQRARLRMRSITMARSMLSVGRRVDDSAKPLRR